MVDIIYRGNIEELLSVISHLKKYIFAFVIVLLVLLSIFHFSRYQIQLVPLITITLVLLPAVYYTAVLVVKFGSSLLASSQTRGAAAMSANNDPQGSGLKTPEPPYPNSPTPPPSYEEATRNDHYYQPQPWLPSTSGGYVGGAVVPTVFSVEHHHRAYCAAADPSGTRSPDTVAAVTATASAATAQNNRTRADGGGDAPKPVPNIPSVTITLDSDQRAMEI